MERNTILTLKCNIKKQHKIYWRIIINRMKLKKDTNQLEKRKKN